MNENKDQCIHQLFEAQVERTPVAIAVACEDEQLTYRELNRRANRLARHLRALEVGPEVLVGICMERSLETVVGLLGVLKAGAAYVPLDPALPQARLASMLEDIQSPVLLTRQRLVERLPTHQAQLVCVDTDRERIAAQAGAKNPTSKVSTENLAYVLFTSGSTGRPKGVAIEHRQILNYLNAIVARLGFAAGASFAMVSTFAADLCNTMLFPALCTGGCLHVITRERASDPEAVADYFRRHPIDYLKIVPSHLTALLAASHPEQVLPRQRLVLGGEASGWGLIEKLRALAPDCLVFNHYGPTETTVGVLTYRVEGVQPARRAGDDNYRRSHPRPPTEADRPATVPLGRPLANTQVYILDSHLLPVPSGAAGELYIGGAGLARGYLNRPALSAAKFMPHPFSDAPGARLYRSGDLARYLPNGDVEFLGRIDQQVKVRGLRIELEEIRAILEQHPAVRESVVVVREAERDPGQKRLVAYVVPHRERLPSGGALRRFLREKLPYYMLPAAFVMLEALPLTPNGKIDRRALPAPASSGPQSEQAYVAPGTRLERWLADLWQDVLAVEAIGVHDDFFELGGDSIKGAILVNRIQEQLGAVVHVVALFEATTIAALGAYLNEHYAEALAATLGLPTGRAPTGPDGGVNAARVAQLRRLILPLPAPDRPRAAPKNPPAIFIFSPPRSGSTLLRVMLAGHPQLFAPPALELLSFNTLAQREAALRGRYSLFLEGTLRAIMQIKGCSVEQARHIMQECTDRRLSTRQFYHLMQRWLKDKTLVDKSTTYALDLEILKRAETGFENPLYIHLLRHPCGMIYSFERVRLDQIFFRYEHPFSRCELAELIWLVSHQNISQFLKRVPRRRQYRVKFEDLVTQPRSTVEGICQFLNLELDPEMLQPYKEKRQRMTDGLYPVSRMIGDPTFHEHSGIEAAVADSWKRQHTVDFVGDLTWQMAESLGYKRPQCEGGDRRSGAISRVSRGSADQLLAQLDQLSDQEVASLLDDMLTTGRER